MKGKVVIWQNNQLAKEREEGHPNQSPNSLAIICPSIGTLKGNANVIWMI